MKSLYFALLILPQWLLAIEIGQSREAVIEHFGEPSGRLVANQQEILVYDAGKVVLKNDIVTEVAMLTPNELQAEADRLARMRVLRLENGKRLLGRYHDDAAFAALSAQARLQLLADFRSYYPELDVSDLLATAQADQVKDNEQLMAQLRRDVERAELEQRKLEAQIAEARQRWEQQDQARYRRSWSAYDRYHPYRSTRIFRVRDSSGYHFEVRDRPRGLFTREVTSPFSRSSAFGITARKPIAPATITINP